MARKMKDSGIEWIGEIPEGWEVIPIKYLARYNYDTLTESCSPDFEFNYIDIGSVTYGKGITTFQKFKFKDSPSRARRVVTPGDILISTVRTYLRAIACVNKSSIPQIASTGFLVLQADSSKLPPRFLMYAVLADSFICNVEAHSVGISYPAINASQIVHFKIPLPPSTEQIPLINYLDNHCSKIDVLLSKIHSSIEEYKKLKQAVITQAVTKGVRGEREMKDSGVEWIGEIPKEFDSVQLKFFCKLITDGTHFSPNTVETGLPYITAGDVHGIGLDYNSAKRISEDDFQLLVAQGCQPLKGDVLLVKDGATTGRVGFVDSDTPCVILSSVAMLRPADKTDGHYLMYLLASDFLQKQILVSMAGSAMPRTTLTKLTKYIGLLPPLYEQKEIANYLDAKCAEIDRLIAKKEQLVKELESYKKSLIYEVATGKREV